MIRFSTKLWSVNPILTILGAYDVIIYYYRFIFLVCEHRKSAEGGTFSSFWPDLPLYFVRLVPLELNCFCFFSFSTFFILTSVILSRDHRVRLLSLETRHCKFALLVPWESSFIMPSYPIDCMIDPCDIFASNESVVMLIGVPSNKIKYWGQTEVKWRSNHGQILFIPFWWMFRVTIRPWLLSQALVLPRLQMMLAMLHLSSPISKSVSFSHNLSVIFLPDFVSFCISWSKIAFALGPSLLWSRHLI